MIVDFFPVTIGGPASIDVTTDRGPTDVYCCLSLTVHPRCSERTCRWSSCSLSCWLHHLQLVPAPPGLACSASASPARSAATGRHMHSLGADGVALGAAATTAHADVEMIVFVAIMLLKVPASFGLVTFLLKEGLLKSTAKKHLLVFSVSAPLLALLMFFCLGQLQNNVSGASCDRCKASWLHQLFLQGVTSQCQICRLYRDQKNARIQTCQNLEQTRANHRWDPHRCDIPGARIPGLLQASRCVLLAAGKLTSYCGQLKYTRPGDRALATATPVIELIRF
ncbi:uncharacterized protein LOC134529027 isoform X2 [Bacillus rossius redtenbacheri]|uniref:uncharacterized protein LOC134529027 isoform X2 n=1 Tax=Bacillus rossius redtenbacheri TaxID=93214 RepID=UPI002FDCBADF